MKRKPWKNKEDPVPGKALIVYCYEQFNKNDAKLKSESLLKHWTLKKKELFSTCGGWQMLYYRQRWLHYIFDKWVGDLWWLERLTMRYLSHDRKNDKLSHIGRKNVFFMKDLRSYTDMKVFFTRRRQTVGLVRFSI